MGEFGDKFRKAREKKGVSLDDASNATKIGSRMLQAIEEEHFDRLPGGVFNKGFIRAYAKHLGLNDEEAVAEYLECLRQAQIEAQAAWLPPSRQAAPAKFPAPPAKPASTTAPAASPPASSKQELPDLQLPRAEHVRPPRPHYPGRKTEIPWRIVAVATLIIVLAVVLWNRHTRIERLRAANNAENSNLQAQPTPNSNSSAAAPSAKAAPSSSSTPTNPNPQLPPSGNPPAAAHSGSSAQQNAAAHEQLQETEEDNQASEVKRPANVQPQSEAPAINLVIRALENSWISVSADGQTASQETLIAPAETSVRAKRDVVVRVGNAAGVSFLLNGKEIPPQGNESEVKSLVFDANGLRAPQ